MGRVSTLVLVAVWAAGCGGERDVAFDAASTSAGVGGAAVTSASQASVGGGGGAPGAAGTGGSGAAATTTGAGGTAVGGAGGEGGSSGPTAPPTVAFTGYPLPQDPDPALPTNGTLRVLLWTTPDYDPADIAATLEQLVVAHPDFTTATIVSEPVTSYRLTNHYYAWTDRDARLATLDDGWDYVVIGDVFWSSTFSPDLYYAGVAPLADLVRAHGATPVLLSRQEPMPAPDPNGEQCVDACEYAGNGECGDGGPGATAQICAFGTDCTDCGTRDVVDAPAEGPEATTWRVAVGTGSVPVYVGPVVLSQGVLGSEHAHVSAAGIYTALFGTDASASGVVPASLTAQRWATLGAAVHARFVSDASVEHYTGPAVTGTRVGTMVPETTYRFMTAGTSSEAGYRVAMQALLDREGWTHTSDSLGSCSTNKSVTTACGDTAIGLLGQSAYQSLYARGYQIEASYIQDGASAPDFMAQTYDRHRDSTLNEGIVALDDIYDRCWFAPYFGRQRGLSWLPMHLSYGELKIAYPNAMLLSDGVHATSTIQTGLAAMSYVSRTGFVPSVTGLSAEDAFAVSNGERLVRTYASMTRTGLAIADLPAHRVVVATP